MRVSVTVRLESRLLCALTSFSSAGRERPPQPTAANPKTTNAKRAGKRLEHDRTPDVSTDRCFMARLLGGGVAQVALSSSVAELFIDIVIREPTGKTPEAQILAREICRPHRATVGRA